jgi:hypothetical protein
MDYMVVFSAEGMDNTAFFETAVECDIFARLMAEQGRLVRVKVGHFNNTRLSGIDITEKYVTIIKGN